VLHFEGKIWRTLPLLAWRPGQLTRRYIEGERARFVSPMALFLFSVFLMFAVFNFVGGPVLDSSNAAGELTIPASPEAKLKLLQQERANAASAGLRTDALDLSIAAVKVQAAREARGEPPEIGRYPDLGWLDTAYRHAKENPALLAYKVQTNAYKFSWMLIPISVPFVWMLFLHRRRYWQYKAYDHTVFVTYSLAFMTLLVVTLSLLHAVFLPTALSVLAVLFVPPIHIFRQLRGAYQLRWYSALWRTFVLVFFGCMMSVALFMLLLLVLGVMH
jgi:hypothetical protein